MIKAKGTCPACQGTTRVPAYGEIRDYISGYDRETETFPCGNCGAQYMYGKSTGEVPLQPDGTPCQHDYEVRSVGRCLHQYQCRSCGDIFHIDSGD